jgi:hypothetical protein
LEILDLSNADWLQQVANPFFNKYPEMNILSMDFRHSALNVERIRSLASGYMQLHAAGILIPNFTSVPGSAVPISTQICVPVTHGYCSF